MSKVRLYKSVEFSAAHRMYNREMSEEKNRELYGSCMMDHGHNYRLVICLEGEPDPATGMFINMKEVKKVLQERIVHTLDHRHLNDVPGLQEHVPTLEVLVIWIWDRLKTCLPAGCLKEVTLYETERTYASYSGPEL
ncbi:6-pyruvoyl trahydropterin synthase family protein [Paenibacillus tarimensis]|uniref:6-pyruvoyl trahydropterin synthase family protein n=1 Tax=Paenibacillus tarimensis TaxID=416012 RepID=UPI001F15EA7B|nr:6-carboxytetrahydropterin synthase [Paenibacillus tarimensis]MCF2945175.1 6-carboxytetrahydropterin synthase [Paenibacillus tarimensis]